MWAQFDGPFGYLKNNGNVCQNDVVDYNSLQNVMD
jgi:hypothetical protein